MSDVAIIRETGRQRRSDGAFGDARKPYLFGRTKILSDQFKNLSAVSEDRKFVHNWLPILETRDLARMRAKSYMDNRLARIS